MGRFGAGMVTGFASARKIDELALEGFDVLLMDLDRILERLEPIEHALVVLLVAGANRLLLGEFLACIGKHRFLLRELALQRLPLPGLGRLAVGAGFTRKVGRALALARRRHVDALLLHRPAFLADRVGLLVGQRRAPVLVLAVPE